MKHVLEFGVKLGSHIDNVILPSNKAGMQLACALVCAFENKSDASTPQKWITWNYQPRRIWESPTHFVSLTRLDGKDRGSASAELWKASLSPIKTRHL